MTRTLRRAAFVLASIALLAAAGCATRPVPSPSPVPPPSEADLRTAVSACHGGRENFTGRARIRVRGVDGTAALRGWITVRFPESIRLEVQDPIGRPTFFAVVDGGVLRVFDAAGQAYYRGPATAANVDRFLKIDLEPAWAARILTGVAARGVAWEPSGGPSGRDPFVARTTDAPPWSLTLGRDGARVTRAERAADGASGFVAEFSDFAGERGCDFPRTIHARAVASGAEIDMIYGSVEWDRPLPPDFFVLPVPEGVRVVELP